ncbi:transcription initiation factor IIE subunit alpha isoform X2 [Aristolochia californica]|uniref:transcription initiation factor IIE subunit alpha isoform X2 n=1 Tax=Aristolochia californica TaxID=171875 RepID=UPI0035D5B499
MSIEPFNRLVKLAARAFYDDIPLKGDNQPKNGRSDNRGMAVVILDALTRRQWIREDDLAKDLRLHSKQLRRTLRFFEEEKLIARDSRKETAKGAKIYNQAVAATADGQQVGKDGEEKIKLHVHSYCCLDYAQIYDVVRYRIHRMKKKLKDELDNRNTIQEYICPNCSRRYSALDALQLISLDDEYFHCENCNGELVAESDKLAAEEMGDGDDNARKRRREKLKDMLQRIEVQLKPLVEQLQRVKDLTPPDYGNLQAWEAINSRAVRAMNGDSGANDSLKSSQGQGYGGPAMPLFGNTKVEVEMYSTEVKDEDTKPDASTTSMKVVPPWMIKQGMNLTKEQRGEIRQELKDVSMASEATEDKKSKVDDQDDQKKIQDEFLKAYYAAILKRQQEREEVEKTKQLEEEAAKYGGVSETITDRRVGEKSKRQEEGDNDIEWEETPTAAEVHKIHDLNIQAEASGDDDDDDGIDWEEG